MFRSFIYVDEEKLYTYKRQLDGEKNPRSKSITQKKGAEISISAPIITASGSMETSTNSDFGNNAKDIGVDYDQFEQALSKLEGEDYFDFVVNQEYELKTIPGMNIIRICSPFTIPEQYDIVNLVEQFKPIIMDSIQTNSQSEQKAIESILGNTSPSVPIIIDSGDITISGLLNSKFLFEEYASLEDYAEQDVYIVCKVVGISRKEQVEIFDPLKNFIHIPRMLRKQMMQSSSSTGLEKIKIEGPVMKVEIIAIYK